MSETYEEHYGTFENFQKECAEKALKYMLENPAMYRHKTQRHCDYLEEVRRQTEAVDYLKLLIENNDKIKDPIYWGYWCGIKDKKYDK